MRRWFGRITVERTRRRLVAELRSDIEHYKCLALESLVLAERASLNAQQYRQLAEQRSTLLNKLTGASTQ